MPLLKYEGKRPERGKQQGREINNRHNASDTGLILEKRTGDGTGGFEHAKEDGNDG